MKLKHDNPSSRKHGRAQRARPARVEPSTFAWTEPLDVPAPRIVEKEVFIDREVVVEKPTIVEKLVEKEIYVDREVFVDRPTIVEKIVEKPVVVEKFVDRPVVVEKEVFVDREVIVERPTIVERIVEKIVEKPVVYEKEVAAKRILKLKSKKQKSSSPAAEKAIIIGRGPTLLARIGRLAPSPSPVFAGVAALLIAIVGVALISPSSENASAARSNSPLGVVKRGKSVPASLVGATSAASDPVGSKGSRDPFAAQGYRAPKTTSGASAATGSTSATGTNSVATPATTKTSLFAANFTTYSSYTPWEKSAKRAGGWIIFDGKPTVKVVAIGSKGVDLFVVTDVQLLNDKSKNFTYSDPVRMVHLNAGGIARFADYRNIQGEDVTYTVRFNGSKSLVPAHKH